MRNKKEVCEEVSNIGDIDGRSFMIKNKWWKADISRDYLQLKKAYTHYLEDKQCMFKDKNIRRGIHSE